MKHAYLTKRDINVARVLKQVTKTEFKELEVNMNRCSKKRVIKNIILHNLA